jgi:ribosome maturation factor RimP
MPEPGSSSATSPLVPVLAPALEALGLELFDVEITGSGRARTLRVFVDRPATSDGLSDAGVSTVAERGVDLDAITAATEAISPVLDHDPVAAAALPGPYTLEVSSPGLERSLRTPAHFRSALGSPISIKSCAAGSSPVRRRAVLLAADETGITLDVDGVTEHLAYDDILQARTVFEWGPAPKPGRARSHQQAAARSRT